MEKYALVFFGGGVGAICRYAVAASIMRTFAGRFPLGTFVVNIAGAFLIGLLMTAITGNPQWNPNLRLLLVVGFLGGFTTFSSLEYETWQAARDGGRWVALLNVGASVIVGYAAVILGALAAGKR